MRKTVNEFRGYLVGLICLVLRSAVFPGLLLAQCPNPTPAPPSKYLSDSDPGYHRLEELQATAYESKSVRRPAPVTPEMLADELELEQAFDQFLDMLTSGKELDESTKEYRQARREAWKDLRSELAEVKLPTRYENLQWYEQVSWLRSRIESVAAPEKLASAPRVIFGTLPKLGVNAQTFPVPGHPECRVVAINEDLFDAVYWIIRDLVLTLDWSRQGGRPSRYDRNYVVQRIPDPDIQRRFAEALSWYLGHQNKPIASYPIEPRQLRLAITLVTSMEMFALAHEYAHVLLGHKFDVQEVDYSWLQEITADELGFMLMLAAQRKGTDKREKLMGFWGAELMLDVMNILETSQKIVSTGKIPPAPMEDPMEKTVVNGAIQCMGAPQSTECKTFQAQHYLPNHPPLWLRVLMIRNTMRETPPLRIDQVEVRISDAMDDKWDFSMAMTFAGMALLRDQIPLIAPKSVSPDNPREQEK